MIDLETLDRTNLFDGINDAARRELATRSTLRHFTKDEVLWTAGSEPRGLFVILEGSVRVVRDTAGRHSVIHTEGPNGTLGEVPLFEGNTLPATAIASEATECVCITAAALDAAIQADSGVARIFLGRLAKRVRGLVDRVERLSAHSVRRRLAAFLLERDRLAGRGRGRGRGRRVLPWSIAGGGRRGVGDGAGGIGAEPARAPGIGPHRFRRPRLLVGGRPGCAHEPGRRRPRNLVHRQISKSLHQSSLRSIR